MHSKRITKTSRILLDVLNANGKVWHDDLRIMVHQAGGHWPSIPAAAKALRDAGHKVVTVKAGVWSQWFIAQTPAEIAAYERQELSDAYSEFISMARAHQTDVMKNTAIAIGAKLGKTLDEVLVECKPIPLSLKQLPIPLGK